MQTVSLPTADNRTTRLLAWLSMLLFAGLYYWQVAGTSPEEARISLRYLLFAWAGLVAFATPYLSFPDPRRPLWQLANLTPSLLLRSYLYRHRYMSAAGGVIILGTVASPLGQPGISAIDLILMMCQGVFLATGIYLYAAYRYLKSGADSQFWHESEKGRHWSRRVTEVTKYPVDPGALPSLLSTVLVTLLGMLAVVAGAFASLAGGLWSESAWALLVCLLGWSRYRTLKPEGDRWFYHTQAFFGEYFGDRKQLEGEREEIRPEQLWWIPSVWRSSGWGLLLQMDRKLPAGRVILAGHLLVWFMAYRGSEAELLLSMWTILALLHHGLLFLTTSDDIAPAWWMRWMASPAHWIWTRFWVQVRWLLPLLASMALMSWLFPYYGVSEMAALAALYLLTGLAVATGITMTHESNKE